MANLFKKILIYWAAMPYTVYTYVDNFFRITYNLFDI